MSFKMMYYDNAPYYWTFVKKVIVDCDIFELEDETLFIHTVHGDEKGLMTTHSFQEDRAGEPFVPVTPGELEALALSYGYTKWVINPCYPSAVRQRYPELSSRIIGSWNYTTSTRRQIFLDVYTNDLTEYFVGITCVNDDPKNIKERHNRMVSYAKKSI